MHKKRKQAVWNINCVMWNALMDKSLHQDLYAALAALQWGILLLWTAFACMNMPIMFIHNS